MNQIAEFQRRAFVADTTAEETPAYHEVQRDILPDFTRSDRTGREGLRKGNFAFELDGGVKPKTIAESVSAFGSLKHLEWARYLPTETLEQLAKQGQQPYEVGVDRGHALLRRGRMQVSSRGDAALPLTNGSVVSIDRATQDSLAEASLEMDAHFAFRAALILPESLAQKLKVSDTSAASEQNVAPAQRGKHVQAAYELMLALATLQRECPSVYASLLESSQTLKKLGEGNLQPLLSNLSHEFQLQFAADQKDLAWAWRNRLEPGKSERPAPALSERDLLFRNQMGLGMLEYLLPTGQATLEYLRAFGQAIADAPFLRTEIKEEHMQNLLVGVPLQGGEQLIASPELLVHCAREHHELWRFSREVSWLIADPAFHQPERVAHKPWAALDVATKNRDILNIFGVAYMLGQIPEDNFNQLAAAAAPGNPLGFRFHSIEK